MSNITFECTVFDATCDGTGATGVKEKINRPSLFFICRGGVAFNFCCRKHPL